ncbi:DMT family transporter [Candidatus Kaiserbacteria bacterium]|nr:DMT family transporter [Candidatus Kaiserbacteria bacterium]
MSWFFIALTGTFLYALSNHIDKILLEKYFRGRGVGVIILFSSLLSVFVLPFLYLADPSALRMDATSILVLAGVGTLHILVLWFYLLALRDEEASVVVIFFQLAPVFGLVLGFFLLGEVLTRMQLIAMAVIILGTTAISFEIDAENNFKLRRATVAYMLAATFFWALGSAVFKGVALEENVWRSLFWEHLMLTLIGICIFLFIRSYRTHFLTALRSNSGAILSLNVANESLYILGNVILSFAFLLSPIALILLTNSFQPVFVLALGIFLTLFFPKISAEKIHVKHIWQKIIAICITAIGTYLLFIS